jgi:hypothetical protein
MAIVMAICCGAGVLSSPARPVSASASLTVTPDSDLVSNQFVRIHGSGFPTYTTIRVCTAVHDATPSVDDCLNDTGGQATISDGTGSFTKFERVLRWRERTT